MMYVILDNHECNCACHYDGIPLCNCQQTCVLCDICHLWVGNSFIQDHIKECHESTNCVKCEFCEINIHSEYIQLHLKFCKTRYGTKTK